MYRFRFKNGLIFRSSALDRMTNEEDVQEAVSKLEIRTLIGIFLFFFSSLSFS